MEIPAIDFWRALEIAGVWAAAAGTFFAACTALWLASRQEKPRLKVSAGHRLAITPGAPTGSYDPEYVVVSAINIGPAPVTVESIGWQIGLIRKKHLYQLHNPDYFSLESRMSSELPIRLGHNEKASWYIEFGGRQNWAGALIAEFLSTWLWWQSKWIKVVVHTNTGQSFTAPVEKNLPDALQSLAKKNPERVVARN